MSEFAVISENDISDWDDTTGEYYNYPNKYRKILEEGCRVIYYKSGLKDSRFWTSPDLMDTQLRHFSVL